MKYVKFKLWKYPKFASWGNQHDAPTWPDVFKKAGLKTAKLEDGYVLIREDEFTWFLLRWL